MHKHARLQAQPIQWSNCKLSCGLWPCGSNSGSFSIAFRHFVEMTASSISKDGNIIAGKTGSPCASHSESGHCTWAYLGLSEVLAPPSSAFLVIAEQFPHSQITPLKRDSFMKTSDILGLRKKILWTKRNFNNSLNPRGLNVNFSSQHTFAFERRQDIGQKSNKL